MKGSGGPGQTPPPGSGVNPLSWKPQIVDGRRRRSRGRGRRSREKEEEQLVKTLLWSGLGGREPSSLLHLMTSHITLLSTEMMETETPPGWTLYCTLLG